MTIDHFEDGQSWALQQIAEGLASAELSDASAEVAFRLARRLVGLPVGLRETRFFRPVLGALCGALPVDDQQTLSAMLLGRIEETIDGRSLLAPAICLASLDSKLSSSAEGRKRVTEAVAKPMTDPTGRSFALQALVELAAAEPDPAVRRIAVSQVLAHVAGVPWAPCRHLARIVDYEDLRTAARILRLPTCSGSGRSVFLQEMTTALDLPSDTFGRLREYGSGIELDVDPIKVVLWLEEREPQEVKFPPSTFMFE